MDGRKRTVDCHVKGVARANDLEEAVDVLKDPREHVRFCHLRNAGWIFIICMCAIMDDSVHIQIQIVCMEEGQQRTREANVG